MTAFTLYKNPKLLDFMKICYELQPDAREQFEAFAGVPYDPEEVAAQFSLRAGPRWLLCADEQPLAVAGFDMIRTGVWQDWMLSVPQAWEPAYWRGTTRYVRQVMDAMLKTEAHRLQCVSLASRIHAHRWYRCIGLAPEGTLHGYGAHGENAIMFARTRDE